MKVFYSYKALYKVSVSIILFAPIYPLIINVYYVRVYVVCATLEMENAKMTRIRATKGHELHLLTSPWVDLQN